jgi:hypothetical protein
MIPMSMPSHTGQSSQAPRILVKKRRCLIDGVDGGFSPSSLLNGGQQDGHPSCVAVEDRRR